MPKASFSIWAYLCSVSVSALKIYVTGYQFVIAAKLPADATAETTVSSDGSYRARTSLELKTFSVI